MIPNRLFPASITAAVFAATLVCTIGACVLEDEFDIDDTSQHAYVQANTIWPSNQIAVCWESTAANATERGWVRDQIEATWEAVSAVDFTGWGACTASATGIRIFVNDERPHTSGKGTQIDGVSNGMTLNFTFNLWGAACNNTPQDRRDCIEWIAAHEFGHALGFAHEHLRGGGDTPAWCNEDPGGTPGDVPIGAWDVDSIMNYCNPDWNGHGQLSPTDIEAVNMFYGDWLNGSTWEYAGNWCSHSGADIYRGDFNGDGRDDLLCHDDQGRLFLNRASTSGRFYGSNWSRNGNWCSMPNGFVYTGDFNGDSRVDILCHDRDTGKIHIDFANSKGQFYGNNFNGSVDWCSHWGAELHVGDFNGDGRDDLLCHDIYSGHKWIDYADAGGKLKGTDWERAANWCSHSGARLHIGDFDGDGRDDMLCHDYKGRVWVDLVNWQGEFWGTNYDEQAGFCKAPGDFVYIGDFSHDGRDDVLCHNSITGFKQIDFAHNDGELAGTDWSRATNWCSHAGAMLLVGDFNGKGFADMLCHDVYTGHKWSALGEP